jgi:2-iminoacetate synthase
MSIANDNTGKSSLTLETARLPSPMAKEIIDEAEIGGILESTRSPSKERIETILKKALLMEGLDLEEVGCLLYMEDPDLLEELYKVAHTIKMAIYGERLVFFAPLYISSHCVNDCEYCGFHARNLAPRKKLSLEEVREQTKQLIDMGHKRLLLEFGEHPKLCTIDYVTDVIKEIYATKSGRGEIRRVNVNIAATSVENYRKLKETEIGTYQLFQETYHRETYATMHHGLKADYERQLFAMDRAFEAGIDDVGIGVLFGLYDHKFEVLALASHARYLDNKYGVGPHTISFPRFQPADTVNFEPPYRVSEKELLKIIAILRCTVPYTGMILTTRESPETRAKAFELGISQTSAASRTAPGGYGKKENVTQFHLSDHRTLDEVVISILKQGLMPSFCTACYREGRTGEEFMHIAKPGEIHHLCRPNAILTLKEYLEDYASDEVKVLGEKITEKYIKKIKSEQRREETKKRLKKIEAGERDLYF